APRASQAIEPEPVSEPIQPWVTPEPPRRPWFERFGPAAAVVLLIVALCWSAWMSLAPPAQTPPGAGPVALRTTKQAPAPKQNAARARTGGKARPQPAPAGETKAAAATPDLAKTKDQAGPPSPANAEAKAVSTEPVLPAGTVGRAEKPTGILLRDNKETRV